MKTTPWFSAVYKRPVRVGAYEVHSEMYKYWDGKKWGFYAGSPHSAYLHRYLGGTVIPDQDSFQWRGLLKESK
jgi:hypothetical protein